MYTDQNLLMKDLNQFCNYRKTIDFFVKCKGLHTYFEKHGGSLDNAVANAEQSMKEKNAGNRDYTYSELGRMILELDNIPKK